MTRIGVTVSKNINVSVRINGLRIINTATTGDEMIFESLAGTKNGLNRVFTTSENYKPSGAGKHYLFITLNGVELQNGIDYLETGANEITIDASIDPPINTGVLTAHYVKLV